MTLLTGSEFFPGGMGEFHCPQNDYLVFEQGPSVDVTLQWATYRDASDQTSMSRIWGGIHPPADDIPGRIMGQIMGPAGFHYANRYFTGQVSCPWDFDASGDVGFGDLTEMLIAWGACDCNCFYDVDGDGQMELVLGGDKAGKAPPEDGYRPMGGEKAEGADAAGQRYVVGGKTYDDWDSIPERYKSLDEDDPGRSSFDMFKFRF